MYTEEHPIRFQGGIHGGTLEALAPYGPHGLRIAGLDPSDMGNWKALTNQYQYQPQATIQIGVEHPDPATQQNLATIARRTIQQGRSLWNGKVPPPEAWQSIADQIRAHEGGTTAHVQTSAPAPVTGDMSVLSKWTVVALGELQQPGGVGATQDYNPVVDGPNPDQVNPTDNAGNSPEQEVALQTWVNMAVDKLNRGEQTDAILAQLAHDGCPEPEKVLQRALSQPDTQPVSDEAGQNPFEVPTTPDPSTSGQMESTSMQPPVLAATEGDLMTQRELKDTPGDLMEQRKLKDTPEDLFDVDGTEKTDNSSDAPEFKDKTPVQDAKSVRSNRVRVAGTTLTGTEVDRWEDMWGEGSVRIALDEGGTVDVAPSAVEPLADGQEPKHAVTDIQKFIDDMPEVQPTRPFIEARLNNLELVRRACRATISKVAFSDQVRLEQIDRAAENETALLKEVLGNLAEGFEVAYAKALPKFAYDGFKIANVRSTYDGHAREAGAIWATENFDGPITDNDSFVSAAAHFASSKGMTGEQFKEFLAGAEDHRVVRTEEFTPTETEDFDGPADELFL